MFGDTVIGSSRYSGSITWLSRVDLPGLVGYSGNYVSGVITENTVWTRSNSPYIVSGHIGVCIWGSKG